MMIRNNPISARTPVAIGLIALFVLLGGFGYWASQAPIAGAIVAPGQIEVEQSQQVVQHPHGGVVEAILVDEGQEVAAGDVLMRLDATLLKAEQLIIEDQWYELLARRARLQAERDGAEALQFDPELDRAANSENGTEIRGLMDGQSNLFNARADTMQRSMEQLSKRADQIREQILGIEAQQESIVEQLDLLGQELESQQRLLEQGLAQVARVLALQREEARLNGLLGELTASAAQAQGRITEFEIEALRLNTARREEAIAELRDTRVTLFELATRRNALQEQLTRLEIRAPVSGRVHDLQFHAPRAVLRPAEPVLYLVPQDRPLVIASRVAPTDVDQVFVGQNVILRFSAFDARESPELNGRVVSISADAFVDEKTQISFYRAEIVLPEQERARLPEEFELIPGMPVEAYMRTGDRTLLTYLVKPLSDYFNRAFREG